MAWFYGTYACGHEGRENIIGPTKNREWIAERRFERDCPECYEKYKEEQKEKANAEALAKAQEMELPELIGTEKQVAWANTLRQKFIDECFEFIEKEEARLDSRSEGDSSEELKQKCEVIKGNINLYRETLAYILENMVKANWYIDERDVFVQRTLEKTHENVKKEKEAAKIREIEKSIEAEITIRPEEPRTETVAVIKINGNKVSVRFPERRESFKEIVKGLEYKWDYASWYRDLDIETEGTPIDRAAELGHKLLENNYIVRIADPEAREKAISGEYVEEQTHWIYRRAKGDYAEWFAIWWRGRSTRLYNAARKITRSAYDGPCVVAPPEHFEEVLAFATKYGFSLTKRAQEGVEKARLNKESALVVKKSEE